MKSLKLIVSGLIFMCICGVSHSQDKISDPANPGNIKDWRGKTVIYFAAHPDDEIASSGTLSVLTKNGNTVYVIVTDIQILADIRNQFR